MADYATRIAPDAIRLERILPGPIEKVWAFLTDAEKRSRWLCGGEFELRVGGRVTLDFNHSRISHEATPEKYRDMPMCSTGEVLRVEPPKLLEFTWLEADGAHSQVTWELAQAGDQVLFTITHRQVRERGMLLSVSAGWDVHVSILDDLFAGRTPRGFWSSHDAREKDYEKRFPG
jgi:uncharacterized protein YndB with AHSA1/START domain